MTNNRTGYATCSALREKEARVPSEGTRCP